MEGSSLNHYEEQLYSMFKSFDVHNEDSLDETAVRDLCDALQLEERGAALGHTLFDKGAARVTFDRFRSGLLAVLGDSGGGASGPTPRPAEPPPPGETTLEPRFVFGSKRYGRRSRPAQPDRPVSPRAASASRVDAACARTRPRTRRSASAMESRDPPALATAVELDHLARIDRDAALALCRDLRMDAIDARVIDRVFEDSPTSDTTVGEFFRRLDSTLATAVRGGASPEVTSTDLSVSTARLVEEWERAGVRRPRRLLAELGFGSASALSPAELERALDAELEAYAEPAEDRAALLTAALALSRLRGVSVRAALDTAAAERDKMRADAAEANARAALLAAEVDEEHARSAADLEDTVRRAEARHAKELAEARADADAAQERWSTERARLATESARRGAVEAETRLRGELEEGSRRAQALEKRAAAAETALEMTRAERARLEKRLEAAAVETASEVELRVETEERLGRASRDLRMLQDRVDELTAALEVRGTAPSAAPSDRASDDNLSAELGALLGSEPGRLQSAEEALTPARESTMTQTDACDADEESERVRELERALEAMRTEYDSCEEYWADKQRTERQAHDHELRAADTRLADLLARVQDFERLAPPARVAVATLPPIPEAPALEAQTHALEAECAAARRDTQRLQEQLARAHRRLAALQRRRDVPPAPAPAPPAECARCRRLEAGAGAAGARALRAELAARQLQARLVAADALVKDLYVENCQLARNTAI